MPNNDRHNARSKRSTDAHHEAGLVAAQAGDIAGALEEYGTVLGHEFFVRAMPEFLDDVLALGEPGEILLRDHRDRWEEEIRKANWSPFTVDNMELFNVVLNDSERDICFYQDLIADPLSNDAALLICLGAILFRLENSGRDDEIRLYASAFVSRLEHVVTSSQAEDNAKIISSRLSHIRDACIHAAVYLGDSDMAARAVQNLLLYCPYPSLYFEVKLLAEKYGEIIQVPLELAFNQINVRDKLGIIVSECLAQTDPEDLISIGAPLDEYSPEASALVSSLTLNITIDELTAHLNEIWRLKFGQYWKSSDGRLGGPYDSPNYKAPDLSESAKKIFEAIEPHLKFLHG